jgi:hypothetical protein
MADLSRTPEEYEALAHDPSSGGWQRRRGEREREAGSSAERTDLVAGPITRDPSGRAEFIDAHGTP